MRERATNTRTFYKKRLWVGRKYLACYEGHRKGEESHFHQISKLTRVVMLKDAERYTEAALGQVNRN